MGRVLGPVSKFVLLICLLVGQWHLQWVRLPSDKWQQIIQSDGAGYYAYLPAIFIFKSFDFEPLQPTDGKSRIEKLEKGGAIKYFVGESILLLPFFTIADLITQTIDLSTRNGYSFYYQLFVSIAALFYVFLGLISLRFLLLRMGFSDWITAISLAIVFFGTQLYFYSLQDSSMSHVYSFSMVTVLMNLFHLQIKKHSSYRWLLIAIVSCLVILLRPVNGIFILSFLFLLNSKGQVKDFVSSFFKSGWPIVVSCVLITLCLFYIQAWMYFLQTGNWWLYSYSGEGFNWEDPQLFNVLFSYRKGLFVYTPVLMLAIPGLYQMRKKFSFFSVLTWLSLIALFAYITSSWWYWAYGGSFGMRPFIDSYGLFAIPLASAIEMSFKYFASKLIVLSVLIVLTFLQLFQTFQYITHILPYENINQSKYWHLFLKSTLQFRYIYPPDIDFKKIKQPGYVLTDVFASPKDSTLELFYDGDENTWKYELLVSEWKTLVNLNKLRYPIYAEVSAEVSMVDNLSDACFIVNLQQNWQVYFWERRFFVHQVIHSDEWTVVKFVIPMPEEIKEDSYFVVSMHNRNKEIIKARKLRVRIFSE